jgi:lipoprotein-anchoring transpeptidase ErfK/SrfK
MSDEPLLSAEEALQEPRAEQPGVWRRVLLLLALVAALAALSAVGLGILGASYVSWAVPAVAPASGSGAEAPSQEVADLRRKLAALRPREPYIVIDTYRNRLRVHKGEELLRDAVCSTGSGVVLLDPRGQRTWTFDSPLGERRVQRKVKDPVWSKPDWAFIEEGFIPPADARYRFDDFSLGAYALYMGDGYIIHGTVFQTLLGRPVTHGCVRLGDEDLEYVYRTVPVGARVYLY